MNPWIVILALAMAPAVSNGFARFAYALILPAMRADLGWTYSMAGWINTANAIGYLLGALLTFWLSGKVASARLFTRGMLATALALLASGMTADITLLSVFRVLAGIGGAAMFISGAALVAAFISAVAESVFWPARCCCRHFYQLAGRHNGQLHGLCWVVCRSAHGLPHGALLVDWTRNSLITGRAGWQCHGGGWCRHLPDISSMASAISSI